MASHTVVIRHLYANSVAITGTQVALPGTSFAIPALPGTSVAIRGIRGTSSGPCSTSSQPQYLRSRKADKGSCMPRRSS